jgi:hypothetical protein
MVKSVFENLAIDVWIHDRKLGFTQPSLCVFHEKPSIGGPFLEALRELNDGACPAKLTLTFAACSRKKPIDKLKLRFVLQSEELRVMNVRCEEGVATVQITSIGLPLLIDAFSSWLNGSEDFGVSPRHSSLKPWELGQLDRESGEVWFWGPGYLGP